MKKYLSNIKGISFEIEKYINSKGIIIEFFFNLFFQKDSFLECIIYCNIEVNYNKYFYVLKQVLNTI